MKFIFDVQELYYLAQYLPVFKELQLRGVNCEFVIYEKPQFAHLLKKAVVDDALPARWVRDKRHALAYYLEQKADWVVFGNRFFDVDTLHTVSKSAQMGHAIGIKNSYYTKSETQMTVRFMEGPRRLDIIRKMYPKGNFVLTGFAKLDPLHNKAIPPLDLSSMGLDPTRKTILYAPTFYPSSIGSFAHTWPREFSEYNLIVKPHYFSMTKDKYRSQRRKFEKWATFKNVYFADIDAHSLLPFMISSDLLISEASSSIFEFAALDKPIVWCDFFNLRWSYKGPFHYRFTRRMDQDILKFSDIGAHAENYGQLKSVVDGQLRHPHMFREKRRAYCDLFVGPGDGRSAVRVVDYLMSHA